MLSPKDLSDLKKAFPFILDLGENYKPFTEALVLSRHASGCPVMDGNGSCSKVIFVTSGLIRIYKLSEDGKEITLYRIGRGETCILTAACLLGQGEVPFPVAATAEQDTTFYALPSSYFKTLFYASPPVQRFVFSALSSKFYTVLGLLEDVAFKKTSERLMDFLIVKTGSGAYPLYATHESVAAELGTAREVVSRLLKEMEISGQVILSRGKIILFHIPDAPQQV